MTEAMSRLGRNVVRSGEVFFGIIDDVAAPGNYHV